MNPTKRNQRVFQSLEEDIDAFIIVNASAPHIDEHFFYVSNLFEGIFEQCAAVIYPDGSGQLLVSTLEAESAKKSSLPITVYQNKEEYNQILTSLLKDAKTIGFNGQGLLYHQYLKLMEVLSNKTFADISTALQTARMRKDEEEQRIMQTACDIAVKTMQSIPDMVHTGMTEDELAAEINYTMQKHGASAPAFDTIASFGAHTAQPHYTHGATPLKKGDFILCDFGARYRHYHSDITRTFVHHHATLKQKRIHDIVFKAQKHAIEHIKPSIIAADIYRYTRDYIDNTEFSGRFIHSTGHSLGLQVHDGGIGFHELANQSLQQDMVLTVEPGIYIPGMGGVRIEDDILITESGCRILTECKRDLLEI